MTTLKKTSLLRRIFRRVEHSIVIQDYTNPLCSKLPNRLNMAEEISLIFPYDRECFLRSRPTHVGISDSFGRVHWAESADVKNGIKQYDLDFPSTSK